MSKVLRRDCFSQGEVGAVKPLSVQWILMSENAVRMLSPLMCHDG